MLGNQFAFQSHLLGFKNLGILRYCVLFLLWNFSLRHWVLSLFLSLSLSLSLSLFLSPFIAFVVDIILTAIVEYFWDLHCLVFAVVFVLLLFIRGHNIDREKQ